MIINKIKYKMFVKKWRNTNSHNFTYPVNITNDSLIQIGKGTYGPIDVLISNSESSLIIGNYCSIAANVKFLLSGEHCLNNISTFPFKTYYMRGGLEALSKGNIVVDDDVWIGYGATILSGIHIGQGAVIAAGSIVTKDVPPYAIVGGNPAKIIKYRFSNEIIQELLKIDYSKLNESMIKENIDKLYTNLSEVSNDEINSILNGLNIIK